ncbi:MAG: HAMP domain-containing histidine kinase [Chloroflexi bacterium]|nr:HAMP domain-containing histidine kinase [Chloroflexota bacterium]
MSIRLRFTLVYSAILALTLLAFGSALYSLQAQNTLTALKEDVRRSSDNVGMLLVKRVDSTTQPSGKSPPTKPVNPMPFTDFSSDQTFQNLPEREIVRVLDNSGNLVASPLGRSEDALPLSAEGLSMLQSGQEFWEIAAYQGQRMLILSRPVTTDAGEYYILQVARSLAEREWTLLNLRTTLIFASIVTLMIAFGIGWLLGGITLSPIQRITQTARDIGNERDFSRRVEHHGPNDELGQLAATFNTMLGRLQDAYERMARALDLQRSFVADVSHELRTPLTTLRGNLGLLQRVPAIPAGEQREILSDMESESDRMIRLVNELLELARAEAKPNYNLDVLEVTPVLEYLCRQQRQLYPQRNITLQAEDNLVIMGDGDAFRQVLLIALDNALKHTAGEITVYAGRDNDSVVLQVRDQGMGIPPEQLEHIFDRFSRGEGSNDRTGFGLGLAIAKTLTERQGGSIRLMSEVGKGSIFELRFEAAERKSAATGEPDEG